MNKIIKVVGLRTPVEIKKSIKNIIDQLEANSYAFVYDSNVVRIFSRYIKNERNKQIYISIVKKSARSTTQVTDIISLSPNLKIVRKDAYSFRLKVK